MRGLRVYGEAIMTRIHAFNAPGKAPSEAVELTAVFGLLAGPNVFVWIDLEKPAPEETKAVLEDLFHFHPLSIEDCVLPSPSPKVEEYNPGPEDKFTQYLFVVAHAVNYNKRDGRFATVELNFFLGKNFLVTYHDEPLRAIGELEQRLGKEAGRAAQGADRLAHLLLDTVVEDYKPALDELSQEIGGLEQSALQEAPTREMLNRMVGLKREVRTLTRIIGPQTEVLGRLAGGAFKLIRPKMLPYFRDVHYALSHIEQMAQGYSDSLTGTLQVYLSLSSNQTGEIVKLLTMITVITTPLMMIGTWYGMNFKDMPELQWPHGYVVASGAMVVSTIGTYLYFKRKKWL